MTWKRTCEVSRAGGLLALMVLTAGCAYPVSDSASDADIVTCDRNRYTNELQALRAEVDAGIGDPLAERVEGCRAIPMGAKACGGPSFYLVYSTGISDVERLERLAAQHRQLAEEFNQACGLRSNCAMTPAPKLTLVDGRCLAD